MGFNASEEQVNLVLPEANSALPRRCSRPFLYPDAHSGSIRTQVPPVLRRFCKGSRTATCKAFTWSAPWNLP